MSETVYLRLRFILIGLALFAGLVLFQLLRIEFASHTVVYFRDLSDTISQRSREFEPERGYIYDRDGELLATNDVQYEIGLSPAYVVDTEAVAVTLSDLLDMSVSEIRAAATGDKPYVLLARPVGADLGQRIKDLQADPQGPDLSGVDLTPIAHRFYPNGTLGASVLGFVAYSQEGRQVGYYGVEGFYNDMLSGHSVKGVEEMVPLDAKLSPQPKQGANLYLTLDRDIQYLVETTLAEAVGRYGAQGGTIIVLNPKTGEILGMTSWPGFDPNNYVTYPPANPATPAVSGQYEPGSTFKILTLAAALDAGTVKPETTFWDPGYIEVGGVVIHNWDGSAWGLVDMTGCMQHSLNVCMAHLSTSMGPATFYNYLSAFGIGHLTNVDLAAEAAGRLKRPGDADWYDADLGANSFGQGVAVTPLQLVAAVSAVANQGAIMQPHLLLRVEDGENTHTTQPQVVGRPIKPETAVMLSNLLANSLELGEAPEAVVTGYRISGKTGTAQIPVTGGYDQNETIASFIGWGPVDDPQFVALVVLDRPTTSIWGSETAAPAFAQMVSRLVVLMGIPTDAARQALISGW